MDTTTTTTERLTTHTHPSQPYGRRVPGCPRCWALAQGIERPVAGWGARRKADDARTLAAIRAHDFTACAAKHIVCTCFDH